MIALACAAVFLLCGDSGKPGGSTFAVLVIFIVASIFGTVVGNLKMNLPPLLGMLIAGLLLRNLPYIGEHVGGVVDPTLSSHIRDIALALILSRAGLGLDLNVLLRMKWVIFRLAFLPCCAEALTVAGLSMLLLDFPWSWALMLGFLWAAISPAVVVPSLLSLLERGYGVNSGIVPAAICAAALDDVCSIAFFGIFLGYAIGYDDPNLADFYAIPLELIAGVAVGAVGGLVLFVATRPKADGGETPALDNMRMYMLVGLAVVSLLGLKAVNYTGCAALSTVVLAVVSAKGWGPAASKRVSAPLTQIWNTVAQPFLFGLVGAEVDFDELDPNVVGIGLGILACSLAARFLTASAAMSGRGLNGKEKLFTALSQLPKATVQAALCAVALDKAKEQPLDDQTRAKEIILGKDVLHLAVLIILCTAPVGATIIYATGPRLLQKDGVDLCASSHHSMVPELEEPTPDVVSQVLSQAEDATEGLAKSLHTVDESSTAAAKHRNASAV